MTSSRILLRYFFITVLLLTGKKVFAQEMNGIAHSNFAGNMGIEMNPASIAVMPYRFEFNILSGDIFLQNDYIYFPASDIPTGKFARLAPLLHEDFSDHYTKPPKNAFGSVLLKGPSAVWRNDDIAFGVHFSLRSQISATNVPYHLAKFFWEGSDYTPQQKVPWKSTAFDLGALVYAEGGFTMAKTIRKKQQNITTGGATLNFLLGMSGVYLNSSMFDYTFVDESLLLIRGEDISYGHAIPYREEKNYLHPRGMGASINLGIQHFYNYIAQAYKPGMSGVKLKKYDVRLGLSLMDIGFIHFSENARKFELNNSTAQWPGFDTTKFKDVASIDSAFSYHLYNDATKSQAGNGFTMILPAAISGQADWSITPKFYLNLTVIQNIQIFDKSVIRPSQVALTPRFETRRVEVSLPLSLYQYNFFRAGLAFRYKWFVLGTDNLGWWPGLYEMNGLDFYFGFKYTSDIYDNIRFKKGKGGHCPAYK